MTHREFAAAMGSRFCGSTMWKHSPSRSRLARVARCCTTPTWTCSRRTTSSGTRSSRWKPRRADGIRRHSAGHRKLRRPTGSSLHNSIEQDADMVILLHRPDAFERDDPRARRSRPDTRPSTETVRRARSPSPTSCTTAGSPTSPTADGNCSSGVVSQIACHCLKSDVTPMSPATYQRQASETNADLQVPPQIVGSARRLFRQRRRAATMRLLDPQALPGHVRPHGPSRLGSWSPLRCLGAGAWATGQKPRRASSRTVSEAEEASSLGARRSWGA